MKQRAFNMIDTSLTLAITLVGVLGVLSTLKSTANAAVRSHKPNIAWQLLDHARTLNSAHLEALNERSFDVFGLPDDESDAFFFRVTGYPRSGEMVYLVEVFWDDTTGREQRLSFERKEVRAYD